MKSAHDELMKKFQEATLNKDQSFEEVEQIRLAERIAELRRKAGLSQLEFSKRIGEDEVFVRHFENKKIIISDLTIISRMIRALNCELQIVFRRIK